LREIDQRLPRAFSAQSIQFPEQQQVKIPLTGFQHDLKFPIQTLAEERLCDWTAVFNCQRRPDAYFEESIALLRSIKTRHTEVIEKLNLYQQHAKGELLRSEISSEIERREALIRATEEKELKKSEKAEKANARTTKR
jgi:hypothetical protein